jgi:hypothetical protein
MTIRYVAQNILEWNMDANLEVRLRAHNRIAQTFCAR